MEAFDIIVMLLAAVGVLSIVYHGMKRFAPKVLENFVARVKGVMTPSASMGTTIKE